MLWSLSFLTCEVMPTPLLQISAVFKAQRSPKAESWSCGCGRITLTSLGQNRMKVMGPVPGESLGIPEPGELGGMARPTVGVSQLGSLAA